MALALEGNPGLKRKSLSLPHYPDRINVPPIKCQGIKTKLVPFILSSIKWNGSGRWVEPFVGSGVVGLNFAPQQALLTDSNVHIIRFFRDMARGELTPDSVREFLHREGTLLLRQGPDYYYEVRQRFNSLPTSHDFLFLNRACFNGVMRFNSRGEFNVPFSKKPDRFRKAYITKIVNQVAHFLRIMKDREWVFEVANWRDTLAHVDEPDFVYADPPYMGRHTDYYSNWNESEASGLLSNLQRLPCGFALSTWKENKYRSNPYLPQESEGLRILTTKHFYHVGSTENLRNEMIEALVVRDGFVTEAPP